MDNGGMYHAPHFDRVDRMLAVLYMLYRVRDVGNGTCKMRDIEAEFYVSYSTARAVVTELVDAGLAEKASGEGGSQGRPPYRIRITNLGVYTMNKNLHYCWHQFYVQRRIGWAKLARRRVAGNG